MEDLLIVGLGDGRLIRAAMFFAAGFGLGWFLPSPAALVKLLGPKR